MNTITTEELKRRMDAGEIAVFDVRGDVDFEIAHLPGAMTAPMGSLTFRVQRVMNPDSAVAVYSGGDGCDLAAQAAKRLTDMGMQNVHCHLEGITGWIAAGYEMVSSDYARTHTRGPVLEVRGVVVDREKAYGGAFSEKVPMRTEGAGG